MSANFSHDELRALMLRHLEGGASADEVHALSAVLRESAEARRDYVALARQHAQLFEIAEERKVVVLDQPRFEAKTKSRFRWPRLAWAAGFVLVAALAALLLPGRLQRRAATAVVQSWQGEVRFFTASGQAALAPGEKMPPGARVETLNDQSSAVILFPDKTRVDVGSSTVLVNVSHQRPGGRELRLHRGTVDADVAKLTPDAPMVFTTPEAEATVIGTVLRLSHRDFEETRLEVTEGAVRLRRLRDNAEVTVRAGQFAVTGPEADLRARPLRREQER
ncbi:MAG: FecR family protein [Verrucomicrobiales bacterium]|nr:FecR family protein [Verrucomicrobiales bacterium]